MRIQLVPSIIQRLIGGEVPHERGAIADYLDWSPVEAAGNRIPGFHEYLRRNKGKNDRSDPQHFHRQ